MTPYKLCCSMSLCVMGFVLDEHILRWFPSSASSRGQRKERMVALAEAFRPLAIPVLGQFQFFPHPAAVVRRLSLTGGAA